MLGILLIKNLKKYDLKKMTSSFLENELKEINRKINSIDPEKNNFNFNSYIDYFKNKYIIVFIGFLIVVSVLYYMKPSFLINKDNEKLNYIYLIILSVIIVILSYIGYTFLKKYNYI